MGSVSVMCGYQPFRISTTSGGSTISTGDSFACTGAGTYVVSVTSTDADYTITPAYYTVTTNSSCVVTSIVPSTGGTATQILFTMTSVFEGQSGTNLYLCGCYPCPCSFPAVITLTMTGTLPAQVWINPADIGDPANEAAVTPIQLFQSATLRLTGPLPSPYPTTTSGGCNPYGNLDDLGNYAYVSDETMTVGGTGQLWKYVLICGSTAEFGGTVNGPVLFAYTLNYPYIPFGGCGNPGMTGFYRQVSNLNGLKSQIAAWQAPCSGDTTSPLHLQCDRVYYVTPPGSDTTYEYSQYSGVTMRLDAAGCTESLSGTGSGPDGEARAISAVRMLGSFAKAAAAQVAAGNPIATPEIQAARKAKCDECPFHDPETDGCKSCGCKSRGWLPGINLSLKRSWETSACPEGRWDAVAGG